ncbi:hypothetical protein CCANI_09485 [Corynebacterium canis]|nr:hypothetical protein CCANI_09485 [Corynebacterium canis]
MPAIERLRFRRRLNLPCQMCLRQIWWGQWFEKLRTIMCGKATLTWAVAHNLSAGVREF